MAKPAVDRVRYAQLFAHVLFHAFNQPRVRAYFLNGERADVSPLGVMFGGELPISPFCAAALVGMGCAQLSMSAGYTPFPAFASVPRKVCAFGKAGHSLGAVFAQSRLHECWAGAVQHPKRAGARENFGQDDEDLLELSAQ